MFKRIFLVFLIIFATLPQAQSQSPVIIDVDPARTISLVGEVTEDQAKRIMDLALMALASNDPVTILIDSPGGLVSGGELLMKAMKKLQERGLKIQCISKRAESMAMYIFGQCDVRYAMPDSIYLWHPVKAMISGPISADDAAELQSQLKVMDDMYNPALREQLGLDEEAYHAAWKTEREWKDKELMEAVPDFMRPIDGISGVEFPEEPRNLPFIFPIPR